jgi:hypothetical protein
VRDTLGSRSRSLRLPRGLRGLTPKFSRMRRRRNSPPRRSLAPHVGCNATLGTVKFMVITLDQEKEGLRQHVGQ